MDPYQRSIYSSARRKRKTAARRRMVVAFAGLAVVALVVAAIVFLAGGGDGGSAGTTIAGNSTSSSNSSGTTGSPTTGSNGGSGTSEDTDPTTSTDQGIKMAVAPVDGTKPSDFDLTTKIYEGKTAITSFDRTDPIDFGPGKDYTALEGIITFRGNNYREGASYGTADVKNGKLQVLWSVPTGAIAKATGSGSWTGSGWTGQPLIIKWPADLKQIMNISDTKKAESGLTEIIYPCLDGKIYFLDLKDGTKTRPAITSGGGPFKGTASLYPDGTPILFVGHGDNGPAGKDSARVRLYSLIDQKLLYTFGSKPDPASHRSWYAYDSSALFDANADTIIEPGENGVLYTIKLNTEFDKEAGTLSIDPDTSIRANYSAPAYADTGTSTTKPLWGMEDSAVAWKNYLYVTDNGGKLFCWNLNTMKLVWVQNVLDDTNTSPVFEEENGHGYIYISTSLHETAKTTSTGTRKGGVPVWKIDAETGEVVWETDPYPCYTVLDVSGGVQDTPVLGKGDISDLVIYAIARTPSQGSGIIVALDKKTGEEVWRTQTNHYMWSSPVAVYTADGTSYIVACDTVGNMFLLQGKTGKILDYINLGSNIEASPAVFDDTIVVGTRGQKIYAVKID
jgi:outer membrane protein assembly factor BamB